MDYCFNFPHRLFDLLENLAAKSEKTPIRWSNDGLSFTIVDRKTFCKEIIQSFFNQTKFTSFTRQLNIYGFKKLHRGVSRRSYSHPFFQKGRRDLLSRIVRVPIKSKLLEGSSPVVEDATETNPSSLSVSSPNSSERQDSGANSPVSTTSIELPVPLSDTTHATSEFQQTGLSLAEIHNAIDTSNPATYQFYYYPAGYDTQQFMPQPYLPAAPYYPFYMPFVGPQIYPAEFTFPSAPVYSHSHMGMLPVFSYPIEGRDRKEKIERLPITLQTEKVNSENVIFETLSNVFDTDDELENMLSMLN